MDGKSSTARMLVKNSIRTRSNGTGKCLTFTRSMMTLCVLLSVFIIESPMVHGLLRIVICGCGVD